MTQANPRIPASTRVERGLCSDEPDDNRLLDAKERKRRQNRVAQRTYRQNQKKKVEALEIAVARSSRESVSSTRAREVDIAAFGSLGQDQIWSCTNDEVIQVGETVLPIEALNQHKIFGASWEDFPATSVSLPSLSPGQTSSPDSPPATGRSSLHRAASQGNEAMCRLLLEGGADLGKHDGDGKTALHIAVENGSMNLVKLMLKNGNPNVRDSLARTALFQAVGGRNEAIAQLLLDSAIDVNSRDMMGEVALHVAVDNGLEAMVRLLLKYGADVDA